MRSRPRIGVIDYGMGNRRSVQKALEHAGAEVRLTSDHAELGRCERLVLPGVGAFPAAMRRLTELGLDETIRSAVRREVPLLGICLGMQLMFERSDELEPSEGLGLLPGEVRRLGADGLRLPHIGWSDVTFERTSPLIDALPGSGCPLYHVHSYAARPEDEQDVIGSAEYGERFATIVGRGHVFGVQFHPEKSSVRGLQMLRAFVNLPVAARG